MTNGISVTKVIGGPGTGKTTRMVGNPELGIEGLFVENSQEYDFGEQLMISYTNAAVDEAVDRLRELMDMTKKRTENRVMTLHGFCLRRSEEISFPQIIDWKDEKAFCREFNLEYGNDDDDDDLMAGGGDAEEGNVLWQIYNWLRSNRYSMEEYDKCPVEWPSDRKLPGLLAAIEQWKESNGKYVWADLIENNVQRNLEVLREAGLGDPSIEDDWEYADSVRQDPDIADKQEAMRGEFGFADTKVLYVDEAQDMTTLQFLWYKLQKLIAEEVYIGGDDDQCLPPYETVDTPDGEKQISQVEVGDEVRSMRGDGKWEYRKVTDVVKKENTESVYEVTTESGRRFEVTRNHKLFARLPERDEETVTDRHYVYLMRDAQDRWRVGQTEDLRSRMYTERNAREIVPLMNCSSKEDSLLWEQLVSLNYGIPTTCFTSREGDTLAEEEMKERLHAGLNYEHTPRGLPGVEKEHDVSIGHGIYQKKATTRGRTASLNINIRMCARQRSSGLVSHQLTLQTRNEEYIEKIDGLGLNMERIDRGDDGIQYRKTSSDLKMLGKMSRKIADATGAFVTNGGAGYGGDIKTYMNADETRHQYMVIPAEGLVEGVYVPRLTEEETVVPEEVVNVEKKEPVDEVFDITVEGTHNFSTNSIGVHNTIYGWSGADAEYLLNEEGETEVLEKTYRIPEQVWQACEANIVQVEHRQDKEIEPVDSEGEVVTYKNPHPSQLAKHINESDDVLILFRARYQIDEFRDELHDQGIPYKNMSTFPTWKQQVTRLRDSLKHAKGGGTIPEDDAVRIIESAEKKMLKSGSPGLAEYAVEDDMEFEDLNDRFTYDAYSPSAFLNWYTEQLYDIDDGMLNWFQKEAVKGNILNGDTDRDPSSVRIGTIHSAKGKEADTVILGTDSTQTIMANMMEDQMGEVPEDPYGRPMLDGSYISDDERRVMYVGMSRAERKLVLAEGAVTPDTALSIKSLISDDGN